MVGAGVSGAFLWIIGVLNLLVLLDILGVWKQARARNARPRAPRGVAAKRGLINRLFGGRLQKLIRPQLADVSARPAVRPRLRHGDRKSACSR